ncbi:MAG: YcxB family protein [Thermoplasmatota archaeon]
MNAGLNIVDRILARPLASGLSAGIPTLGSIVDLTALPDPLGLKDLWRNLLAFLGEIVLVLWIFAALALVATLALVAIAVALWRRDLSAPPAPAATGPLIIVNTTGPADATPIGASATHPTIRMAPAAPDATGTPTHPTPPGRADAPSYAATPKTLRLTRNGTSEEFEWNEFKTMKDRLGQFVLFDVYGGRHVIPKRAFTSARAAAQFSDMARAGIGQRPNPNP